MFTKKKSTALKPPQTIQKAFSPKPAKVGMQPMMAIAPKGKPKTKIVKKAVPKKSKKIIGHNKKVVIKGKPVTKPKVKGLYRSVK